MQGDDKDNQEGRINQCFYFDKTLNKRLYIASINYLKKAHLWKLKIDASSSYAEAHHR